jgi:ParB family chromosome partitioning protein
MKNMKVQKISLDLIDDPKIAIRSETDDESIDELMHDMREVGLIQPVVVRPIDNRFEVIAGHRRTRAARLLGWPTIEAKIVEVDDNMAFSMRVIENISRKDVDPVDEACFINEIMNRYKKSIDEIAQMVKRSRGWVEQRLNIFNMPAYLQEHLHYKKISLGVALALNKIIDEKDKRYYSDYAATQGAGIAIVNRWVLELNSRKNITDEIRQDIIIEGQKTEYNRKQVVCDRCNEPVFLDEADTVWVHCFNCLFKDGRKD